MHQCHGCPAYVPQICSHAAGCHRSLDIGDRLPDSRDAGHAVERTLQFAVLAEQHHRRVVAWACRLTGSYDLARDLAQDVFLKALIGFHRFRAEARFSTWLYTITRNRCRDHAKQAAVRGREAADGVRPNQEPTIENEAIAALDAEYAAALLRRVIREARLDAIERRAMALHYAYELPLSDVTARLGLTNQSGARAQIVSAKRKLRTAIETFEGGRVRTGLATRSG